MTIRKIGKKFLEFLPQPLADNLQFRLLVGYWPAAVPRTFNEKIMYRKKYGSHPLFTICADKLAVKDYVARQIGGEHLIPTLFSGSAINTQDIVTILETYPRVVAKTSHGSGSTYFLNRTLTTGDIDAVISKLREDLAVDYGAQSKERWYSSIPPNVLIEPDISPGNGMLVDYKFHVFSQGGPEMPEVVIQADFDRHSNHTRNLYDLNGNLLDFSLRHAQNLAHVTLDSGIIAQLAPLALELAQPFSYARVDLYASEDGPRFGEMTFAPGGGYEPFYPARYDRWLGDLWVGDPAR